MHSGPDPKVTLSYDVDMLQYVPIVNANRTLFRSTKASKVRDDTQ